MNLPTGMTEQEARERLIESLSNQIRREAKVLANHALTPTHGPTIMNAVNGLRRRAEALLELEKGE